MAPASRCSVLDVISLKADFIGGDGIVRDATRLRLSGLYVERRRVPRARDDAAREFAIHKGTSGMGAGVAEGKVLPIDIHNDHLFTVEADQLHLSRVQI